MVRAAGPVVSLCLRWLGGRVEEEGGGVRWVRNVSYAFFFIKKKSITRVCVCLCS
jgi:hypothetical protein